MARKQAENTSFESEFGRLSGIVERLENGNVPLEEMLTLYEEGMLLANSLKTRLESAELRVERLSAIHEESMVATDDLED